MTKPKHEKIYREKAILNDQGKPIGYLRTIADAGPCTYGYATETKLYKGELSSQRGHIQEGRRLFWFQMKKGLPVATVYSVEGE